MGKATFSVNPAEQENGFLIVAYSFHTNAREWIEFSNLKDLEAKCQEFWQTLMASYQPEGENKGIKMSVTLERGTRSPRGWKQSEWNRGRYFFPKNQ